MFVKNGRLDAPEDIFWFSLEEIEAAHADPTYDLRQKQDEKKPFYRQLDQVLAFPHIIDSRGRIGQVEKSQGDPNVLSGLGISRGVATGRIQGRPHDWTLAVPGLEEVRTSLVDELNRTYPGLPQKNWVALRLLQGDRSVEEAVQDGRMKELSETAATRSNTAWPAIRRSSSPPTYPVAPRTTAPVTRPLLPVLPRCDLRARHRSTGR